MSKKILCISFINGTAEYTETKKSNNGRFTVMPSIGTTSESLLAASRRADEIYVSTLSPGFDYDLVTFPKVQGGGHLRSQVSGFAKSKSGGTKITSRHQHIRDIEKGGKVKSLVAFQSVKEAEITSILQLLDRFRNKIKSIHTLPAVLAGALVQSERPAGSFLLIWTKENTSIISIVGEGGLIQISRTLPYGLPGKSVETDEEQAALQSFSDDINREVIMTVNYFKKKFRDSPPNDLYLIGDNRLHQVLVGSSLKDMDLELHSGFSSDILPGVRSDEMNGKVHLLGSLLSDETFNFLPSAEAQGRKINTVLSAALGVLALLLTATVLWTFQAPTSQKHHDLVNEVRVLQSDIQELQMSVNELEPVEEQINYYRSTFLTEKPPFIAILEQIGAEMPNEMVFDTFRMTPDGKVWNCMITGKISGSDWRSRLDTLRSFGRSLSTFPNVDIQNVTHTLQQAAYNSSTISFQMSLQFIPGEVGS